MLDITDLYMYGTALEQAGKFTLFSVDSKNSDIQGILQIVRYCYDNVVIIADIKYLPEYNDCYIQTRSSNMQDHIIDWTDYCDFVKLLDSAYDRLKRQKK